jgi:hypothetical protein
MFEVRPQSNGFGLVLTFVDELPERIDDAWGQVLGRGMDKAVGVSQRQFLQGPRPQRLGEVTTRLRQSMTREVVPGPEGLMGRMGPTVTYGGFHEFGFHGTQQVKPHTRMVSVTSGIGSALTTRKPIKDRAGNIVGYKRTAKSVAAQLKKGAVTLQPVKAHTRKINYAGRPFARPALELVLPVIVEDFKTTLGGATNG